MIKYWTIVLLFLSNMVYAQGGFTAAAVIGATASQIDGDALYGFDKVGLTAGAKIGYHIDGRWKGHLEMLYSQRGSSNSFNIGSNSTSYIATEYIELPLLISLNDWYVSGDDYYRASIHTGLSPAYLFSVKSNITDYESDIDNYNRIDLSWMAGCGFRFSKSVAVSLRYTRALTKLRKAVQGKGSQQGIQYFWAFRTEYQF